VALSWPSCGPHVVPAVGSAVPVGLILHDGGVSATPVSEFGPRGGWYAPYRTIHVVSDLDMLSGPLEGKVRLPLHLDASARATYDVGDVRRRSLLYEVVILEAWKDEDFAAWLNRDALIDAWPTLYLPRQVRAAWEARHPVLAARGAGPDVPRP
jgi:hypothetical protein